MREPGVTADRTPGSATEGDLATRSGIRLASSSSGRSVRGRLDAVGLSGLPGPATAVFGC